MQTAYRYIGTLVPESNRLLAFFAPLKHKEAITGGEFPDIKRWYIVQTITKYENRKVLPEHMQAGAQYLREHYTKAYEKIRPGVEKATEKMVGQISQDAGIDVAVTMNEIQLYPIHEEETTHFSHSIMTTYDWGVEGEMGKTVVAGTIATA